MNQFKIIYTLLLLLFAYQQSFSQASQTDEIINHHCQITNYQKLEQIKTIVIKGYQTIENNDFPMDVNIYLKKPDKIRVEGNFMNMKLVQTINGKEGWLKSSLTGKTTLNLTQEQIMQVKKQLDLSQPLYQYRKKGYDATLLGKESINGRVCHKIKLVNNTNKEEIIYALDEKTYEISLVQFMKKINGKITNIENKLQSYRQVSGMLMPYRIITYMNGKEVSDLEISEYLFDTKIEDSIFTKP